MVEIIGLATLCMLLWVLASSMAAESNAENGVWPSAKRDHIRFMQATVV